MAICNVEDCERALYSRLMCARHYGQAYRNGEIAARSANETHHRVQPTDTDASPPIGICSKCGPAVRIKRHGSRYECHFQANFLPDGTPRPRKPRVYTPGAYRKPRTGASGAAVTPAQRRRSKLKYKYGITESDYERMYAEQAGCCAVCSAPEDVLCVDHSHETGAVRALLCRLCNWGLGNFRDDPVLLANALAYLTMHGNAKDGPPPEVGAGRQSLEGVA